MSLYAPFVPLIAGLAVSQWARTLPALAAQGLIQDLGFSPPGLGFATGLYHLGFALGQVPCGVALDRFGVRRTASVLLAIAVAGMAASALAPNQLFFAAAQLVTGVGCCGGLMCGLRWAAHALPVERFGAASGYILALGSLGLLASGTPSAWILDVWGWRGGYAVAAGCGAAALAAVLWLVPHVPGPPTTRSVLGDAREVLRLVTARKLVPLGVLAFVGYSAFIGTRGLWAGPWLTDRLGLALVPAGNALLLLSFAMAIGPAVWGFLDSRVKHRALVVGGSHVVGSLLLLWLAAGGGGGADILVLTLFMLLTASHVLLFAMTRARVDESVLGKAMSAVNLSFFGGVAVLQPLSGIAAGWFGLPGAIGLLGLACLAGALAFFAMLRAERT